VQKICSALSLPEEYERFPKGKTCVEKNISGTKGPFPTDSGRSPAQEKNRLEILGRMGQSGYNSATQKKTAQQCDPPNGYPRHASCESLHSCAGSAPRVAIGDRGRWEKINLTLSNMFVILSI
jgi:hypothetical protein